MYNTTGLCVCSSPLPTVTTGRALLARWWRSVRTGQTARRRGLWSWLHREGLANQSGVNQKLFWCAFIGVTVACVPHTVLFPHLSCIDSCRPKGASIVVLHWLSLWVRFVQKWVDHWLLIVCPSLFIHLMTSGCVLLAIREPTVYKEWHFYRLMKICVL